MAKKKPNLRDEIAALPDGVPSKTRSSWLDLMPADIRPQIVPIIKGWIDREPELRRKWPQQCQLQAWLADLAHRHGVDLRADSAGDIIRKVKRGEKIT